MLCLFGKLENRINAGTGEKLHTVEQVTSKLKIPGKVITSSVFLLSAQIRTYTIRVRMCALWWSIGGSNPWSSDCEPDALPTKLIPQKIIWKG